MSFLKNLFGPPDIEKLKENRDVDGLIKVFTNHKELDIRAEAALALGEVGDKRAVEALMSDRSASYELTLAIVKALGKLGDPRAIKKLLGSLGHPKDEMRDAAAQALTNLGERAVPHLVQALVEASAEKYSTTLVKILSNMGSVESLVRVLNETRDPHIAEEVITALGQLRDHRATAPIARILIDKKSLIPKKPVMEALGCLGDERAVEPLLSVLNDLNAERMLRRSAAEALGKLGSQRAKDALLRAYNGKDVEIAAGAAVALKAIGYSPALEPLLADLKLDNVVGRKALATLAAFGDTRAVKPLVAYLEDPDSLLIREAVDALKSIDPEVGQNTVDRLCAKNHAFGQWRSVMPQFKQDNRYVHTGERTCQRCGTKEQCTRHDFGAWTSGGERSRTCRRCGYRDVDIQM